MDFLVTTILFYVPSNSLVKTVCMLRLPCKDPVLQRDLQITASCSHMGA